MKRSIPSIIAGVALLLILVIYMVTYQIRFTEVGVVRTFGKATEDDVVREAGLHAKWPWPIQRVSKYDNRIQFATTTGEETPTRDAKNIVVTTAIGWRIENPYMFSIRCADETDAANKLKTLVRNDQKTVIAQYDFANFVSTDMQELQYDDIEQQILALVAPKAQQLYGIDLESIGIEQLALPERITESVFEAMKKERQAVADQYISEGEGTATTIKQTAEGISQTILSFAERKAAEIVAEGQRRAAQYNRVFSQDEALAMFLLEIENLGKILKDRTTLVLDADEPPFSQLKDTASTHPTEASAAAGRPPATAPAPATLSPLPEIIEPQG